MSTNLIKSALLIVVIAIVVGAITELIRSVPDPNLWSSATSGWIAAVVTGAIVGVVITSRSARR